MEKTKYLIGDVANLMGLSRDTMRYYEKRGIITSEKGQNGYRYYTDKEISRLVSILYQRKMNVSLEDMKKLWNVENSMINLTEIMDHRLKEEERAIRSHRQTIARLRLTSSDCQRIREHLGEIQLKDSPYAYLIVPHTGFDESMTLWFQLSKKHSGLDMMYLFDEYRLKQQDHLLQLPYQNTQLILYRDLADYVDYEFSPDSATIKPMRCLYSACTSPTRIPGNENILPMLDWAREQGLTVSDHLYSTYAMQGQLEGRHAYYLELYIPLR